MKSWEMVGNLLVSNVGSQLYITGDCRSSDGAGMPILQETARLSAGAVNQTCGILATHIH